MIHFDTRALGSRLLGYHLNTRILGKVHVAYKCPEWSRLLLNWQGNGIARSKFGAYLGYLLFKSYITHESSVMHPSLSRIDMRLACEMN